MAGRSVQVVPAVGALVGSLGLAQDLGVAAEFSRSAAVLPSGVGGNLNFRS